MKAVGDRIIIEKVEVKTTSASGIEVAYHKQRPQIGIISQVGPDCKTAKVGYKAVFAKGAGTEIIYENKTYFVMRESDLFFVDTP